MAKDDLDFANKAISAEERLANLVALDWGLALAMDGFLRRLDGYVALLEEELEDRPGAAQYLRQCRNTAAGAIAVLDQFRQGVRCELEFEPLDIRLVLEGAVKSCRRVLAPEVTIELAAAEDEILVDGALFQLQDLFRGMLLAVARRKLTGAPAVPVQAQAYPLDEAFFRLMKSPCSSGHYFVVSLGGGFDPARQTPLWDVLLEAAGPDSPFGMDFLQIRGIAAGHRGDLLVGRGPGGGRTFSLLLPIRGRIKEMQAPHNLEDKDLYGKETILLVDDEDMIWDVIIDMLQELGYTVILAANGREAIEIYRANPGQIDLVLLDMVMPEMDGYAAFFELKKIDPKVRVLLSSGYVSEEEARSVLDAGAAGFLRKPYRMVDLARRVRSIFGRPSA